uniref:Uncharacterized protein n=1 Tax=Podoviridae sp. ct1ev3 TaxID=2825216 RepID=A0A8S5TT53_9CAUD|nr:MAG TPA: hypothetical protein [Podoviridae sp. ct1ev3]
MCTKTSLKLCEISLDSDLSIWLFIQLFSCILSDYCAI